MSDVYLKIRREAGCDWYNHNFELGRFEIGIELDAANGRSVAAKLGPGAWNDLEYLFDLRTSGGSGSAAWGEILGTLANQVDLQTVLDAKSGTSHNHDAAYEAKNANIQSHVASTSNPHSVTKSQVGLGNADNTSDVNKPVSTAQSAAIAAMWPVGSVYISVLNTNPSTLFGFGTWAAFATGRTLVGIDGNQTEFDAVEKTGGAKTGTPAGTNSAPIFTGSALGTHSHGAGTLAVSAHSGTAVGDHAAHTHSVTSNVAVGDHASHTHTYTDVPNHVHTHNAQGSTTAATTGGNVMTSTATGGSSRAMAINTGNPTTGVATGTTAGPSATLSHSVTNNAVTSGNPSATLSHSVTQPADHTLSGSSAAVSAGTPAGSVSAPTFTGNSMSVLPPYIVVYMWKRTA